MTGELVPFLFQGHVIVHVEGEGDTFLLYSEDDEGRVYVVCGSHDVSLPRAVAPGVSGVNLHDPERRQLRRDRGTYSAGASGSVTTPS